MRGLGSGLVVLALLLSGCVYAFQPLTPPPAPGQLLVPGERVRVFVPASDDYVRTATLVALTGDSIVLAQRPRRTALGGASLTPARTTLPLGAVGRLEASRGFRRQLEAGLAVGVVAGAMLAVVVGGCLSNQLWIGCPHPERMAYAFFPVAILGGLIGFQIKMERWEEVSPDELRRVRVGVMPRSGVRLGLGASIAF